MQGTTTERSLAALGDYLFELETRGKKKWARGSYGISRSVSTRPETATEIPSQFDKAQESAALEWENEQIRVWRSHGRITADGVLRVATEPLKPYTLKDMARIMPQLNAWDRVAALIDLDGVVERGYMAKTEHENIRAVVEHIADKRLALRLQDEDTNLVLRDIVRAEVAAIFGELRLNMATQGSTLKPGGYKQKCSKCKQPGHRAPTCGAERDKPLA